MFTFKVVEDYNQLQDEYFKFRYKIIHDELNLVEDDGNKMDFDEYDKYSVHFIAYDTNNNICATTRLILNSALEYPTKKYMKIDIDLQQNANFAELSRVFIDKKDRNFSNSREIMYRFIKDIHYYILINNIHFIFASMEKKFIRLLHMINIDFTIIGKGGEFYGFRYPCITTRKGLAGKNPYLEEFF